MITTEPILLQIENLHTFFYSKRGIIKAVNGIDFLIPKGKTVGLVGESGCGKSVTALSIIRLVQSPGRVIKGSIFLENQNLLDLDEQEMRHIRGNRISMIFQEPMTSLNPVHCIGDQISEAIWLHQGFSKRQAIELTVEMLRKVGISDPKKRIKEYPHQISGGMRQRVMIAMALSCKPQMIIADEPTTALDVTIQAQILDLMDKLRQDSGVSILLITHDLGIVAEMAHSVIVMYAGKILEYADSLTFFDEPKHPYTLGLLESIPKMYGPIPDDKILSAIPGVVPNLLELPKGCSFESRCSVAFDLCKKEEPFLFEVGSNHLVRCWQFGRT